VKSSRTAQNDYLSRAGLRAVSGLLTALLSHGVGAVEVSIELHDRSGAPLAEAVVALYAHDHVASAAAVPSEYKMDQVDKQFMPRLLAIRAGDRVSFPNSDNIRHHVYSFSPANTFELPLYRGIPSAPVTFSRAGKVVLGCNIHDRMSAHIYVLDTPLFARTTAGRHVFPGIAPGDYEVAVFHPRQRDSEEGVRQALHIPAQATQRVELTVDIQDDQAADVRGLSTLELKFQELRRGAR
jgi:plastocyanin